MLLARGRAAAEAEQRDGYALTPEMNKSDRKTATCSIMSINCHIGLSMETGLLDCPYVR